MDDFRIKTSWRNSPKRKRLRRLLGADAVLALEDLWSWCASERPDGDLAGLDDEGIELACDWAGEPGALVSALVDLRLLDGGDGERSIHEWQQHNGYCAGASQRVTAARANALSRWHQQGRHPVPVNGCPLCGPQCGGNAPAMRVAQIGNAPSPSPSPAPAPKKEDIAPASRVLTPRDESQPGVTGSGQLTLTQKLPNQDRDAEVVHAAFAQWRAKHPGHPHKLSSSDKRYKQILARVREGYTRDDLLEAIEGAHVDTWVVQHKAWTIQHIFRSGDMIEKYAQAYRERINGSR